MPAIKIRKQSNGITRYTAIVRIRRDARNRGRAFNREAFLEV